MKKLFVFAFVCIALTNLSAQKKYFDMDWNQVEESEASYYRIIEKEDCDEDQYYAEDFYISGQPQWQGYMSSLEPQTLEGHHTYWYENGYKEAEGTYEHSKLEGLAQYWYQNGQLKWKCTYKNGQRNGRYLEWYANGQKKAKIKYAMGNEVSAKYWDENGKKMEKEVDVEYWQEDSLEEIEHAD